MEIINMQMFSRIFVFLLLGSEIAAAFFYTFEIKFAEVLISSKHNFHNRE